MHVLLIEDDLKGAAYLVKGLSESGHVVDHAKDGSAGLASALDGHYDVLIVDRMLPKRDGLTLLRMLRDDHDHTPALVLSALGDVDDRVDGLRAGGDDYLVKPYAFRELLARIEALGRRPQSLDQQRHLSVKDLLIDLQTHAVTRGKRSIHLQPREFRLLEYLMRHAGHIVTRTMLLDNIWDYHFDPLTNVIDVHISRLRAKIDRDSESPLIHTVRGAGYRLDGKS